jgi:UBX domain-containing protein 1
MDELTKRAVESVFGKAKDPNRTEQQQQQKPSFTGRGHKLTDDATLTEAADTPKSANTINTNEEEVVSRIILFWQDGLTIGDGPLRPYSDPATQRLLQQLSQEQVPLREFDLLPNQLVDIKVVHCLERKFEEAGRRRELVKLDGLKGEEKKQASFVGAARKLTDDSGREEAQGSTCAGVRLQFDPDQPSTRLQLRLSNGQRYHNSSSYLTSILCV